MRRTAATAAGVVVRPGRVSTPHPVSRLRKVEPCVRADETASERRLREALDADHHWHHAFWAQNNARFAEEKRLFMQQYQAETQCSAEDRIPPEIISKFYKRFLDENLERHRHYNLTWWRRSFAQLPLFFRAYASRLRLNLTAPRKTDPPPPPPAAS